MGHLNQAHNYWESEHFAGVVVIQVYLACLPELLGSLLPVVAADPVLQVVAALVEKTESVDCEKTTQCLCGQPAEIVEKTLDCKAVIAVLVPQVLEPQVGT